MALVIVRTFKGTGTREEYRGENGIARAIAECAQITGHSKDTVADILDREERIETALLAYTLEEV